MKIYILSTTMLTSLAARKATAFVRPQVRNMASRAFAGSNLMFAKDGQAEVILVGCGAPNRGMGWYHAVQMLEDKWVT